MPVRVLLGLAIVCGLIANAQGQPTLTFAGAAGSQGLLGENGEYPHMSARALKQYALYQLMGEPYPPAEIKAKTPGQPRGAERLAGAIKRIQNSLNPKYWVDDNRLDPKFGKRVFNDEAEAVKDLLAIVSDPSACPILQSAAQTAIYSLVEADEILATTAIADAVAADGSPKSAKDIARANELAAMALIIFGAGKPIEAINTFRKAWEHALKALGRVAG